jgi:hypothetical protein
MACTLAKTNKDRLKLHCGRLSLSELYFFPAMVLWDKQSVRPDESPPGDLSGASTYCFVLICPLFALHHSYFGFNRKDGKYLAAVCTVWGSAKVTVSPAQRDQILVLFGLFNIAFLI